MTSFLEYVKSKKAKVLLAIGITIVGIGLIWLSVRDNAYALSVNGEVVAIIKEKEEAKAAYERLITHIKEEVGVDIAINETLSLEPVHSKAEDINTQEEVIEALNNVISYGVEAYEIIVDGTTYAIVESKEVAADVLSTIAKQYLPESGELTLDVHNVEENDEDVNALQEMSGTQIATTSDKMELLQITDALPVKEVKEKVEVASIQIDEEEVAKRAEEEAKATEGQKIERIMKALDFNEEVNIKNTYVNAEEILSAEEAVDILLSHTEETIEYELQEGDNIWDLAVAHDTTMEHILELNPQIEDETKMQIGEKIKLEVPEPILSISTVEQATFKELIPAEIQYVEFSDLYKDETKVYREGQDGLKEVTVAVTKVNGKEVSRKSISETIITEPKIKVIAYGTKEKPQKTTTSSKESSGVSSSSSGFMHPLNGGGSISSGYGYRWSAFHSGIDFAASAGTPIYAAAAGKVIYSGYNSGGYGNLIIIDHNNGYQTYYAHCSSLYVNVGQTVSKGQNIAGVGSTGNSTGNHLHFEIRSGGTPVNPYNYLY